VWALTSINAEISDSRFFESIVDRTRQKMGDCLTKMIVELQSVKKTINSGWSIKRKEYLREVILW
jgi:hypothetical protein